MVKPSEQTVLSQGLEHGYSMLHFVRYQRLAEVINEMNGRHVLDAGCGIGLLDLLLANKTVTGFDNNFDNVKEAKRIEQFVKIRENAILRLVVADLYFPPFRREFDIIVCSEVLEHLSDDKKALTAMLSVLKEGGFLVASVPNINALTIKRLIGLGRKTGYTSLGHVREYKINDAVNLVRCFRMKIDRVNGVYFFFPLFPLFDRIIQGIRKRRLPGIFAFQVYCRIYELYKTLWLALEKLFWRQACYFLVVAKKAT